MGQKMFLQIEGVKGNSTDPHHVGWFDVSSMSVPQDGPTSHGNSSYRERSSRGLIEVGIPVDAGDKSTAPLLQAVGQARRVRQAILVWADDKGEASRMTLFDVDVTNFAGNGPKGKDVSGVVDVTLGYGRLSTTFGPPPKTGGKVRWHFGNRSP